jgi:hypothetical protein
MSTLEVISAVGEGKAELGVDSRLTVALRARGATGTEQHQAKAAISFS